MPLGLRLAKIARDKSTFPEFKVGACLIEKSRITIAWNKQRTAPRAKEIMGWPDQSHAEFNLFPHSIRTEPIKGTVFVYREGANGEPLMARPCAFCWRMLRRLRIKKVVYTINGSWKSEKLEDS